MEETDVPNSETAIQKINEAITRKDRNWLETNARLIHLHCASPTLWESDQSPFNLALETNDVTILHSVFLPFITFNTYNTMAITDRIRLAPAFIKSQQKDKQARIHTMLLFMNAVISLDLNELVFWHNQAIFAELINAPDYTLREHPIHVALAKDSSEVFEFLLHGGKCTIPELATNEATLRLLVDLLLKGSFRCAEVLWNVVDPNEKMTWHESTIQNPDEPRFSLIYHICHWTNGKAWYCGEKRAQAVKWLFEKGLKDYDSEYELKQRYYYNYHNPAFVVACTINDSALVKVLLEHEEEKWKNNVGPILEVLPGGFRSCFLFSEPSEEWTQNGAEISKILAMLLPLLNPDTKTVDLANALAASILEECKSLEEELKALGADLRHVSRPDDYHFGKARCFPERLKLLNLSGELILPIEDEDTEFIVDRIAVNTKTVNCANLRKKMKNIKPDSEIYFIHEKYSFDHSIGYAIKLWDRRTGRIYKDSPFIRSLFVGDTGYRPTRGRRLETGDDYHKSNYYDRYSIFCRVEDGSSWKNGTRIIYKPVEFPIGGQVVEPVENKEAEKKEQEPRRSTRRSKRTIEELDTPEQPTTKKRKIAKK